MSLFDSVKPKVRQPSMLPISIKGMDPDKLNVVLKIFKYSRLLELDVLLVGGAVRDFVLGKEIADLDFIIEPNIYDKTNHHKYVAHHAFIEFLDIISRGRPKNLTGEHYKCIENPIYNNITEYNIDGVTVQIMRSKSLKPIEIVDQKFDFGICKVVSDSEGYLHYSDAFKEDIQRETHIRDSRAVLTSSGKHIEKLRKKFPEYKFVK